MGKPTDPLSDFDLWPLAAEGFDHGVYSSRTSGPPVVVLHEAPNLTPQVADLARQISAAGFRTHMPSLIGAPGKSAADPGLGALWGICVRREFNALAGRSTRPSVRWIRALVRKLAAEANGAQVGVIGLCFSGGFALGAATEPAVAAVVSSEPALPLLSSTPLLNKLPGVAKAIDLDREDLDLLRDRLASGELAAQGYRFASDTFSPCERMLALGDRLGDSFDGRCIHPELDANGAPMRKPHSVVTVDLVDRDGHPTKAARDRIIAFLDWRLRHGPPLSEPHPMLWRCAVSGCQKAKPASS